MTSTMASFTRSFSAHFPPPCVGMRSSALLTSRSTSSFLSGSNIPIPGSSIFAFSSTVSKEFWSLFLRTLSSLFVTTSCLNSFTATS